MNILYPSFPVRRIAALGAVVAGGYGAVHDQISFAISPEYFTRMKFRQFAWVNIGLPARAFASEVGFLGTWWVGLVAGWFAARAGLAELPRHERWRCTARCFGIVLATAAVVGAGGAIVGVALTQTGALSSWDDVRTVLGVEDVRARDRRVPSRRRVFGRLLGLALAVVYVRLCVARVQRETVIK